MKGWSGGWLEVSKKVEKLLSQSVQHYSDGVLNTAFKHSVTWASKAS